MDPRFLSYYNRELQYVREMGQEFARQFPKIAGRLGLETLEVADPYVERLIESFAFLSARVQLKIDSEFPRFSHHLLEMVYPHYLCPTPSMAMVQMDPALTETALCDGFLVPRGTVLRGRTSERDKTACEFRTAQGVTLWPIQIVEAEYSSFLGALSNLSIPTKVRSTLRLKIRTSGGLKFQRLSLDNLPIFFANTDELSMRLHENILLHTAALMIRPASKPNTWQELVLESPAIPKGFAEDEALLPCNVRAYQGYRLLQEYFAFPARFLMAELRGLQKAIRRCDSDEIEIFLLLKAHDPRLEKAVGPSQFALFCTPIVNLFPRRLDRIHIDDTQSEYHVVPDRTSPMDYEVHSVEEVTGFKTNVDDRQDYLPLYSMKALSGKAPSHGFYTIHRQPRIPSERQKQRGARSSYLGSEVFIALVDPSEAPILSDIKQVSVRALCTNRDLPLHLPLGVGSSDFFLETGAPLLGVRCVAGPTPPKPSNAHGDASWRLISHLSLNYLSLMDDPSREGASALRELLTLYGNAADPVIHKQIEGLRSVSSRTVSRRLPFPGPVVYGRGLELAIQVDESGFEGSSAYMLGMVLSHFFQNYVSINSFTETVLKSLQRGEIARWPARLGRRPLL